MPRSNYFPNLVCCVNGGINATWDSSTQQVTVNFTQNGLYPFYAIYGTEVSNGLIVNPVEGHDVLNSETSFTDYPPVDTSGGSFYVAIFYGCYWDGSSCVTSGGTYSEVQSEAFFVQIPDHTLTVNLSGTGSGVVTGTPSFGVPFSCEISGCVQSFPEGATVQLHAEPADGSHFTGWGDECVGSGTFTGCNVELNRDKVVSAAFASDDTIPPETTITSPLDGSIGQPSRPVMKFTSSEPDSAKYECQVDSGAWAACVSPKQIGPLANGGHHFYVKATDQAGNTDPTPASRFFTVGMGGGPGAVATVELALGPATVTRKDKRIPLTNGVPVQVGDLIKTGANGLVVFLANGKPFNVAPNTEVKIDADRFEQLGGKVRFELAKGDTVEAGNATITANTGAFTAEDLGKTERIRGQDGTGKITNGQGTQKTVTLGKGQETNVPDNGPPGVPRTYKLVPCTKRVQTMRPGNWFCEPTF